MSKLAEILTEVQDLLEDGYAVNEVAEKLNIPVDWVIDTEHELMGMHQYGDEE